MADLTAAIQAALDAGEPYDLPSGSNTHTGLSLPSGACIRGNSPATTILTHTGDGPAFSAPGSARVYGWRLSGFQSVGINVGFDLDRVSSADFHQVTAVGHTKGYRLSSVTVGHAVYNTFHNCVATSCAQGFAIDGLGSNESRLIACRANACGTGIAITDSNHTQVIASAIEGCDVGLSALSTSPSLADATQLLFVRFEGNDVNWSIGANVRDTAILFPHIVGTHVAIDSGTRTSSTVNGGLVFTIGASRYRLTPTVAGPAWTTIA